MKKKVTIRLSFLVLILLASACNTKKAEPKPAVIDKEQIKNEIQAIEDKFALIYTHRNADSLTYYADDAVSYFVGQEPLVGKAAIHQFINEELKEFPEGVKIINKTLEVYIFEEGRNVGEIGEYKRIDSTGKILQSGHYFSFFAKRDGRYVCTRDMATALPSAE